LSFTRASAVVNCRPVTLIFVVAACGLTWPGCDRHRRFGDQLLRGPIEANHGILWIVRSLVNLQHILHAGDEGGIGIRQRIPAMR
jgi:hypothetical protein